MPQAVVGRFVHRRQGFPLLEELAQPGRPPASWCSTASPRPLRCPPSACGPRRVSPALRLPLPASLGDQLANRVQRCRQCIQVTDRVGVDDGAGPLHRRGCVLHADVTGTYALLEQLHLGPQRLVAPREERHCLGRVTIGPTGRRPARPLWYARRRCRVRRPDPTRPPARSWRGPARRPGTRRPGTRRPRARRARVGPPVDGAGLVAETVGTLPSSPPTARLISHVAPTTRATPNTAEAITARRRAATWRALRRACWRSHFSRAAGVRAAAS